MAACRWFPAEGSPAEILAGSSAVKTKAGFEAVRSQRPGFLWLSLQQPSMAEMRKVGNRLDMHPLLVEDAVQANQRPKIERHSGMLEMVMKTLRAEEREDSPEVRVQYSGEVLVILSSTFVVTVRHGRRRFHKTLYRRLSERPDLLPLGPVAVLHAVADLVVDDYLHAAEVLNAELEDLEDRVFSPERDETDSGRVFLLRRKILRARHVVDPLAAAVGDLDLAEVIGTPPEAIAYLRDVTDHLLRVREELLAQQDVATTLISTGLERLDVREGDIAKRVAAWVAIIAVPTAVTTLYGMNFTWMPFLFQPWGFGVVMVALAATCTGMYVAFRRVDWL